MCCNGAEMCTITWPAPTPTCLPAAAGAPSGSPLRRNIASGPRLPNGSLPASAAAAAASSAPALSSLSLLDTIGQACLEAELPAELVGHPDFPFLAQA